MSNAWLLPSVIVSAAGLLVQGIKAGWDLVMSIKSQSNSKDALRLQELNALMNLVAGLPIAEAQKVVWKARLMRLIKRKAPTSEIYDALEALITESVGEGS